jgi:adenylate cyclase
LANEIERKFLIKELTSEIKDKAECIKSIEQAYIGEGDNFIHRIRTSKNYESNSAMILGISNKEEAFLTIKEKKGGLSRIEVETNLPIEEGLLLINSEKEKIQKTRFVIPQVENYQENEIPQNILEEAEKLNYIKLPNGSFNKTLYWEIDVFEGDNKGLFLAEIEIDWEEQKFENPDFISKEVTQDRKYYNAELLKNPISKWKKKSSNPKC